MEHWTALWSNCRCNCNHKSIRSKKYLEIGQQLVIDTDPSLGKPKEEEGIYVVQAGDSLWKIAQKHQVTVDELIKTNNIFSPDIIVPGLRLPIPVKKIETPMITYVISSGDSLWKIAQQYKVTVADLVKKNNITSPDIILPGQSLMIPVNEEIEKQPISHTVATGDTLWLIAQKYHTTIDEITQKNNITNPNNILVGQKLIIQ